MNKSKKVKDINKIYKNLSFQTIRYDVNKENKEYEKELRNRYTKDHMLDIKLMINDQQELQMLIRESEEIKNRNLSIYYPTLTFYSGALLGLLAGLITAFAKSESFVLGFLLYIVALLILMGIMTYFCVRKENKMLEVIGFYNNLEKFIHNQLKNYHFN